MTVFKRSGLLREGSLLFASTFLVNLGNYAINLLLGRWLGPTDFSEVGLLVTLLLMLSFFALGFQLTAARYAASDAAGQEWVPVINWLKRLSVITGFVLAVSLAASSYFLENFFKMSNPFVFLVFGAGMPAYLLMSVNRGVLQGVGHFKKLALTYQIEMWSRLLLSSIFVYAGSKVTGVAIAITSSLLLALWGSGYKVPAVSASIPSKSKSDVVVFLLLILLYECSQILINNSDTILVKHYYEADLSGLYAALALIGRIVYFGTWTVVTLLFPIVIRLEKEGKPHFHYFLGGLSAVAVIAGCIVSGTYLFPTWIINILFGTAYLPIAIYLWKYALATALFACANVFVYYNISLSRYMPVWLTLFAGVMQIVLIALFHKDFNQVITVQIYLMTTLMVILLIVQLVYNRRKKWLTL